MIENFIPENLPNSPPQISLLTILKGFNSSDNKQIDHRYTNVNDLLSPVIRPDFNNIQNSPYANKELGDILTELTRQIIVNRNEIIYTKHLIALFTFELQSEGFEIDEPELIENQEIYLKI